MNLLASLAFPIQANRLDLDDIVRLLFQVPKNTGAAGGVDFPNKSLHVSFLPLVIGRGIETQWIDLLGSYSEEPHRDTSPQNVHPRRFLYIKKKQSCCFTL